MSHFIDFVNNSLKHYLAYKVSVFTGGQLCNFLQQWKTLTSDQNILQTVEGDQIEFICSPPKSFLHPKNYVPPDNHTQICQEIASLVSRKVIIETSHESGEFLSPIFSVPKKDGQVRLILNLKLLNEYVTYTHFKMDSIDTAMSLVTKGCWMASIDLKDAYYTVKIDETSQKYLKFQYNNKLYKYRAYPNGLSSCPRKFTKLLKPILCYLRKRGYTICAYLDDLLLISTSYTECCMNVMETIKIFDQLGFVVHPDKSAFIPQKTTVFLGFNLNSDTLKITLKADKITKIINCINNILGMRRPSIRQVAQIIGCLVSSFPAVKYGKSHYRAIENDKIVSLKCAKGNFDAKMTLSDEAKDQLYWWLHNLPISFNDIEIPPVNVVINSDASLSGWGAVKGGSSTGGQWTPNEACFHINYLELLAAYFALKCFSKSIANQHVKILIDNTTAVGVINNMGTCHSDPCNSIACKIWAFCEKNNVWLTAAHIPGHLNITADFESRCKNIDTEWMLNPVYLSDALSEFSFFPTIDLFASRLNKQFPDYVSYRQDPFAMHIDAFTIPWNDINFYCFPPFSCILKVLRKIIQDQARGIVVVPDWPTQTWYPMLKALLEQAPVLLRPSSRMLTMPSQPDLKHPLTKNLTLAICLVSGKSYY